MTRRLLWQHHRLVVIHFTARQWRRHWARVVLLSDRILLGEIVRAYLPMKRESIRASARPHMWRARLLLRIPLLVHAHLIIQIHHVVMLVVLRASIDIALWVSTHVQRRVVICAGTHLLMLMLRVKLLLLWLLRVA